MTRSHDAWLVDLDGTLYRSRPVQAAMILELSLFGWKAVTILREFRKQHERQRHGQRVATATSTLSPYQRQLEQTADALECSPQQVEEQVREWMQKRPGKWLRRFRRRELLEEVTQFRQAGGRTALVSDYPAGLKLQALGCEHLFDTVVANGEQGGPSFLKPHPEGYLSAAERLGVAPENCLVLGDRLDADGLAAERAHMDFRRIG